MYACSREGFAAEVELGSRADRMSPFLTRLSGLEDAGGTRGSLGSSMSLESGGGDVVVEEVGDDGVVVGVVGGSEGGARWGTVDKSFSTLPGEDEGSEFGSFRRGKKRVGDVFAMGMGKSSSALSLFRGSFGFGSKVSDVSKEEGEAVGESIVERHRSFSAVTRRQVSRLAAVASRRDSDMDSVLSEPVSYSSSTYLSSDIWLSQCHLDDVESTLARRESAKRHARARLAAIEPPKNRLPAAYKPALLPREGAPVGAPAPAIVRNPHADVFSAESESQDFSSRLVRMFFSNSGSNPVPASSARRAAERRNIAQRSRRGNYAASAFHRARERGNLDRMAQDGSAPPRGSFGSAAKLDRVSREKYGRYSTGDHDYFSFHENTRRRVLTRDRLRRLRWWFRRAAIRRRGDDFV